MHRQAPTSALAADGARVAATNPDALASTATPAYSRRTEKEASPAPPPTEATKPSAAPSPTEGTRPSALAGMGRGRGGASPLPPLLPVAVMAEAPTSAAPGGKTG